MPSPGKVFTEPLLLFLVISGGCWIALATSLWRDSKTRIRLMVAVLGTALVTLWIISLPWTARLLESSLLIAPDDEGAEIDAIVILAGGYAPGSSGRLLSGESTLRVMNGVRLWQKNRQARLVMSGGSGTDSRDVPMPELMADIAIGEGVPPSRIVQEDQSRNTREHPIEVLKLPALDRTARIGLVTSRWHLRRATMEFRRHFESVTPYGGEWQGPSPDWRHWVPSAASLQRSTTMIHDWLGIAWYRLLAILD